MLVILMLWLVVFLSSLVNILIGFLVVGFLLIGMVVIVIGVLGLVGVVLVVGFWYLVRVRVVMFRRLMMGRVKWCMMIFWEEDVLVF